VEVGVEQQRKKRESYGEGLFDTKELVTGAQGNFGSSTRGGTSGNSSAVKDKGEKLEYKMDVR